MLDSVTDIVRRASALMKRDGFDVRQKDGAVNLVTSSDLAVQDFLCRELSALIPGSGFICEENDFHSEGREYVWVIDPIDGTANYARGEEHCCISVGLRKNGEMELGVVFAPWMDRMYSARRGCGAFLNGERIHTSSRSFREGMFYASLSLYTKQYAGMCLDILRDTYSRSNDIRCFGSAALGICEIAAGYIEMYFEMRLQPWDYAAAICILREAGGCISGLHGAEPVFDGPDLICAANSAENHAALMRIVEKHVSRVPYRD